MGLMKRMPLFALVGILTILHANTHAEPMEASYSQAYQQSVATGRPLVILVGAKWCHACRIMESSVLPKVAQAGVLRHVAFVRVDLDRQRELATRLMCAPSIPQLIRLTRTPHGWTRACLVGTKKPKEVQRFIEAARPPQRTATP